VGGNQPVAGFYTFSPLPPEKETYKPNHREAIFEAH
jgi:hypothetical protein